MIKKLKFRFNKIYWTIFAFLLFSPISIVLGEIKTGPPRLKNPIKVKTLVDFLNLILELVVKIMTPIVILMIVYSGFLFVKAQGNPEELKTAKKAILWTIIGAVIVLGAFALSEAIKGTIDELQTFPTVVIKNN